MIVRYFAAARAAAGVDEEHVDAATVAQALAAVRERHDARFAEVLACCSLLLDGDPVGRRDPGAVPTGPEAVLEVLPPFAGG